MINWSMNKLKFTSGIGCLCMAGLLGEVYGKHLPFWTVMLVTMPPLVLFLFFQSDDFPVRWVKRFQRLGAIWYFTVAIGLTVLFLQQGHLTRGWPIFFVGLILGGIPCGIVLWRTFACPPVPPPLDYPEPRDIFRPLGLPPPQADTHGANDRTFRLVRGYHRHSNLPAIAHEAEMAERFAVVLDTTRHDKVDWFFDSELFLAISEEIIRLIAPDTIKIELEEGISYASLATLAAAYTALPEADREPPTRMLFFRDGRLVGLEETEFWVRVGGPDFYHDSYTLSFYTARDRFAEFQAVCEMVSMNLGATITGVHEGDARYSEQCGSTE